MAKGLIEQSYLSSIADAIRAKGVEGTWKPSEMPDAILSIPQSSTPEFDWGSETEAGAGDAEWWAGLKTWVEAVDESELEQCLGKTKSVTLTTPISGTTTHLVRCIGWNCNRDKDAPTVNTLTFETANCMANTTVFGSSNGKWTGSTVRTQCQNYYNAFPGKASVATVSIGTCTSTNSSQSGTPTYTDETVFLASDAEHGFPPGKNSPLGKGYSASYDEFDKYNTEKKAYQYCTTTQTGYKNVKKGKGDSGSAIYYWERSLHFDGSSGVCLVDDDGLPYFRSYSRVSGLAPCFVI